MGLDSTKVGIGSFNLYVGIVRLRGDDETGVIGFVVTAFGGFVVTF